ncbi:Mu transposase C-terminal domain-containing protein [Candidatus Mycobacterium wuenschmannii]|uniref:Mu transposase C-terminal domain-containing protein n=1 Tax=Candidatus Mycobacterium wuenschmannii TaxID=3027808 RepID=A0ABY8W411_9MYCO|nr:Mu transposase C-terminal domain-containing protein [Candidatus Mycobacterium wuenschmannii]WIM89757.1 Mu transposase C-terminal domain-containing protein [Candidatus Mycobacterium wuenschmannii]
MSAERIPVKAGTRFIHDGEILTITSTAGTVYGMEVVATGGDRVHRMTLDEVLDHTRSRFIPVDGVTGLTEEDEMAALILAQLSEAELSTMRLRVEHVREVLCGYRSGSEELKRSDEPRRDFEPTLPLEARYKAKAAELGVTDRTIKRWTSDYLRFGEAGVASSRSVSQPRLDERWVAEALEVMISYTDLSRPTRSAVINKARRACEARYGVGGVRLPSRATAYRALSLMEHRHPLFRLSTKRNRDIAGRLPQPYGKLRPTRPGEIVYLDTTRLDVFALDPATLCWVNCELTVALDAYTRCVLALRLTPSTKSIDVASVLYQCFRPRPAHPDWPPHAVWPDHGIPRQVVLDIDAIEGPMAPASGPAVVPETIVVDHGKVYVGEDTTSVCARLGISIQPARIREPRDKAPVERFFRTIRESLLQYLDGYKGPDVHSRGLDVEASAFYYIDELEDIIREWVATIYHHRRHRGVLEPELASAPMSPAMMYEHGLNRAGYIEAPSDPQLAYQFLKVVARTIQHYGVELDNRIYSGAVLMKWAGRVSPYTGRFKGKWPIYVDPDDVRNVYFHDHDDHSWHALKWEHAEGLDAPLSDEALKHMRTKAAKKYRFVDDVLALDELLTRWHVDSNSSAVDRRVALNLAREEVPLSQNAQPTDAQQVSEMRSIAERFETSTDSLGDIESCETEPSDDDSDAELDADYEPSSDDEYYKDALEDL